jgi:hypothetical protein
MREIGGVITDTTVNSLAGVNDNIQPKELGQPLNEKNNSDNNNEQLLNIANIVSVSEINPTAMNNE